MTVKISVRDRLPALVVLSLLVVLISPLAAFGQVVITPIEELDFDRPESWAMKYFTSISLLTGLGAPEARKPGSIEVGLELGSVPHLDREQRTVGFDGSKEEDLNKTSVFARPRVTIGLPSRFSLTAAWLPPVEMNGAKSNLFSAALERPLAKVRGWGLGARIHGQIGEVDGDFTCNAEDVAFAPGSEGNRFGCEAVSDDTVSLEYLGFELIGSYELGRTGGPTLHLGVGVNDMDLEFQVNASTFGFVDRTLQLTEGTTISFDFGATWRLGDERTRISAELFYSPLDIERQGRGSVESDDLLNLRVMASFRVH